MTTNFCLLYENYKKPYIKNLGLAELKCIRETSINETALHFRHFLEVFLQDFLNKENINNLEAFEKDTPSSFEVINFLNEKKYLCKDSITTLHTIRIISNKGVHNTGKKITTPEVRNNLTNAFNLLLKVDNNFNSYTSSCKYDLNISNLMNTSLFKKHSGIENRFYDEEEQTYKEETNTYLEIEKNFGICTYYLEDPDLDFLKFCKNEDLKDLYDILVYDNETKIPFFNKNLTTLPLIENKRISEQLSSNIKVKSFPGRYSLFWKEIAGEFQLYGGNTFVNICRRNKGVLYNEILKDVSRKFNIKIEKEDTTEIIEEKLLTKIINNYVSELSSEDKDNLLASLNLSEFSLKDSNLTSIFLNLSNISLIFRKQFFNLVNNLIMKQLVKTTAKTAAKSSIQKISLGKILSVAMAPITIGWTLNDLAAPAFRVTSLAVLKIIILRKTIKTI